MPTAAERLATIETLLAAHIKADNEAFEALSATMTTVAVDVKSLLATRAAARGVWIATAAIGTALTALGAGLAWLLDWLRAAR